MFWQQMNCRIRIRCRWLLTSMVMLLSACRSEPRFEVPDTAGMRWFKGNTHTHTTMSDGDSEPEVVARWYKLHGYNFLVLSDHNVLTDPNTLSQLADSSFILIPGEEVSAKANEKPIHVNGLNLTTVVTPRNDTLVVQALQKNIDAIRSANGVPHINHPNFRWAIDQHDLLQVRNDKLLEIFNGHPAVNNLGGGGRLGMEAVWDHLLSSGKRVYGIAVDDAHHFQGEFAPDRVNPGRGWVVVLARHLNAGEIVANLEAGWFYASTGVELDSLVIRTQSITVGIRQQGDLKHRTEFIGANGHLLHTSEKNPATFHLTKNENYVRAKVIDSAGRIAWIQPVFVVSN